MSLRCIAAGRRRRSKQQRRRRFLLRQRGLGWRSPPPRLVLVAVWMREFRGLCVIAWLSLCTLASTRRVDSPSGGRVGETFQWLDDALAPLEGHCANYERRGAWWSYQWCHGRDVKQYHRNERGMAESEIILGTFDTVSTRTRRSGARRRVLYFSRVPSRWVAPRSRWATGVKKRTVCAATSSRAARRAATRRRRDRSTAARAAPPAARRRARGVQRCASSTKRNHRQKRDRI